MPAETLRKFLDKHNIKYVTIKHSLAYTAQEIAASAHIHGKEIAKTVIVKVNDKMAMAVIPANFKIDLGLVSEAAGAGSAQLASEEEFQDLFPGCALGAMPPFGILYDLPVYVVESLAEDAEIAFNAGSHTELLKLAYKDFVLLVKPKISTLSSRESG